MYNFTNYGIAKTNKSLEKQFDTATFESGIMGCTREFNAVLLTDHSYPRINGRSVSVLCKKGKNILEYSDTSSEQRYKYAVLNDEQAARFTNIDYDPCRDASYAESLLETYANL